MTTRREIREKYEAIVQGPGKFEGEKSYSPYFYDIMLDGGVDEVGPDNVDVFIVTKEDLAIFPELKGIKKLVQYTNNEGFVWTLIPTPQNFNVD